MTEQEVHATLRADVDQFTKMLKQAALDPESASDEDTAHDDIYMNILDEEVRLLQIAPGEVIITYCSFGTGYFDEITLNRDIREETGTGRTGEEFTYDVGTEAILNVEETLTYLDFASDGGTVELNFTGSTDRRLATYVRAEGGLEAWVKLPGSQDVIENVPHWLPSRFNGDNEYCNTDGVPAPTQIHTKVSKVDKIIKAVSEDRDAEFYPIVTDDETFRIDIGDEDRSGVSGALGAQSVTGPDVENYYFNGFEEIFGVLSGAISLQTAPGDSPLAIVQSGSDDRTIRHVNGSVNN